MLHHQLPVRKGNGGRPVGHHDAGFAFQGPDPPEDLFLGGRIQRGSTLIQQQDGRAAQDRPGNGQPLGLTFGQAVGVLAQHGFQPLGQLGQILIHAADIHRPGDFLLRCLGLGQQQILPKGTAEQQITLGHIGKQAPGPFADSHGSFPTFQAQLIALEKAGLEKKTEKINAQLAALSRSVSSDVLVAGNLTTLATFTDSWDADKFDLLVENYRRQIRGLIDGGVDLLAAETLLYPQEAEAILTAAELEGAGAAMYSFTMQPDGSLFSGMDAGNVLR